MSIFTIKEMDFYVPEEMELEANKLCEEAEFIRMVLNDVNYGLDVPQETIEQAINLCDKHIEHDLQDCSALTELLPEIPEQDESKIFITTMHIQLCERNISTITDIKKQLEQAINS